MLCSIDVWFLTILWWHLIQSIIEHFLKLLQFANKKKRSKFYQYCKYGEQGWCSGESARLPPMWPGFDSRTQRHMWVEFVVGSLLATRGFSLGTPVFPSPQKPTFRNSNLIQNLRARLLGATLVLNKVDLFI